MISLSLVDADKVRRLRASRGSTSPRPFHYLLESRWKLEKFERTVTRTSSQQ